MSGSTERRVGGRAVVGEAVGIGGMAMSITLMFLATRAVMGVGGSCADGGPYVSAQRCPDGATAAILIGVFGLFLFGGVAIAFADRVGGIWGSTPILAWAALFISLGWNFLDGGVFSVPEGSGIDPTGVLLGLLFWAMGGVPLVGLLLAARSSSRTAGRTVAQPRAGLMPSAARPTSQVTPQRTDPRRADALRSIATDLGAAVDRAAAVTPVHPVAAPGDTHGSIVDRLERLADLRERGLLDADEFEAAKAAAIREEGPAR
jgi:hypothetical protein